MSTAITKNQLLSMARQLSREEKVQLITELNSDPLEESPVVREPMAAATSESLDDEYERGYSQIPEDVTEIEALLPFLPSEHW